MLPAVQAQSLNPCTAREVPSVCCLIGIFVFLILSCMSCLCILGINLLLVILFAAIFSHTMDCLFVSSVASFPVQMLLNLIMSYFIFAFVSFAIVDIYQKKKKKKPTYYYNFTRHKIHLAWSSTYFTYLHWWTKEYYTKLSQINFPIYSTQTY